MSSAPLRLALLLAVASAPMVQAAAQQQPVTANSNVERAPGRIVASSWSLEGSINYSDNFSRTAEGDFERRFVLDGSTFAGLPVIEDTPDGPILTGIVPLADTIPLEAVPKTFVTSTFSGTTLFERPTSRGIITGGVRVGHYFDGSSYADEIEDVLNANLPDELEDFDTDDIEPSVGIGNAFQQTFVDPNISSLAQLDLVGEKLYIEGGGFVSEQSLGGQGGVLQQAAGQNLNEIVFGGVYLSPVSFWRLPQRQAIELRARHSAVYVIDENLGEVLGAGVREIGDSVSNDVEVGYSSGEALPFFEFSLGAMARRFEEESDNTDFAQEFDHYSAFGGISYDVTPRFALTARGGYDEAMIESQPATPVATELVPDPVTPDVVEQDLSGAYYQLGFNWRPSRNTTISASGGERFQGVQYQARVAWNITPRLTFSSNVNRQVSSGFQEIQEENIRINSRNLQFLERFRSTGSALTDRDLRTVGRSSGNIPTAQAGVGIRRVTSANVSLNGNYGRTDWSMRLGASLPEREEDESVEDAIGLTNNDRYTAELQISRRVNRRLRLGLQARALAQMVDDEVEFDTTNPFQVRRRFSDDVIEQLYGISADYRVNRDFALVWSYNHLRRSTDQPDELSLFRGTPFEYEENQLRFGARLMF